MPHFVRPQDLVCNAGATAGQGKVDKGLLAPVVLARAEMAKMIGDNGADAADQLSAFIAQKG